ncbi:PEP-CTERM sorting domain-containing protein [Thalassoroseus pseudoceratinae]|uniref:PEP-CTERM sorting domain-containing protein n=1 Tax=Thalassoroseus pseudoceratinae TaxID=2713176 RepID=UPI001421F3A7|nr:PEP-CTERM sorting domain-containing protein [Thalassoroseus pseudoceratinae]
MMRAIQLAVACVAVLVTTAGQVQAGLITIDFDDGTAGNPVDAFYSTLGVTFSNAEFTNNFGLAGSSGSLGIRAIIGGFGPTPTDPIVATFDSPQSFVSITGIDVEENGIRINAFDAPTGGNLVDFDEFFGPGAGVGTFATISTTTPSIFRVEFFQPQNVVGDGVLFEDFSFQASDVSAVPEPSSLALFGIGACVAGLGAARRRRREKQQEATP